MDILNRESLSATGFEGVREHRLVFDKRVAKERNQNGVWEGIGQFVYLADAHFIPAGETRMHSHREIDVISVMLEGRLRHEGSLESGKSLDTFDVQVQRAGGEGFSHNEVNPDDVSNRMIQIWVLPEQAGEPAAYKHYQLPSGQVTRVYGGDANQKTVFAASTCVDVARLEFGQSLDIDKPAMVYVCQGRGFADEDDVSEGDLLRADQLTFDAAEACLLILVHCDN